MEVLESNKNLSIFTGLFKRSKMIQIFTTKGMEKICFAAELCVRLSASMQEHMAKAIDFKQYTILAPTNKMFDSMNKDKLKALFLDSKARVSFLQEHIFLGSIDVTKAEQKKIAYSVSPFHSVLMMNREGGERYLVHSDKRLLQVTQSIPVIEGTVYVADILA